jgi:hypothetical protein
LRTRELIDTAPVSGGGELRLLRRGDEYIIARGGNALVSSRMSGSEEALATMTCDRLRVLDKPDCSSAATARGLRCAPPWPFHPALKGGGIHGRTGQHPSTIERQGRTSRDVVCQQRLDDGV